MKNKIKHITAAIALTLGLINMANAQVTTQKIGANPTTIAPSAVLDIESANKGVLFPRVNLTSTTDAVTIASPAEGLTIYNTATAGTAPNNVSPGYYYWNGTKWTKVATDSESSKWTYDATNSRINLTNLANGTTTRTGATNFAVTDGNVLQIGDMSGIAGSSIPERSIITRKAGNNTITNISDGGIYSSVGNEIYGGTVPGSAAYFTMIKHRGSLASPQAVQNNDLIGVLDFRGGNGAGWLNGARLATIVDGTVTSSSVPLAFSFQTMADGTSILTEKMKISSNGNVGIGTTAPANKLQITQGTAGNSGLRFTNLTSASTATTTSNKVLGLNSTGDVILTNVPGTQNIVEFSVNANPNITGTTFNPATPIDQSVVFQSTINNSLWTYNGTTYVTYTAPASTAWNLANTTTDAGNNKTTAIWRSGAIGIGTNNPLTTLHVNNSLAATNTVNANAQVFRMMRSRNDGVKWENIAQFNLGSYAVTTSPSTNATSRLDLAMNDGDGVATSNVMTWQANGNVGIGTTTPSTSLHIQNPLPGTATVNTDAQVLRLSRLGIPSVKWDNIAQFNLGSFSANTAADTKLDLVLNNTNLTLSSTPVMTWNANGNVGVNTTAPSAPLVVQGVTGNGVLKLIAPSVSAGDNWWMGFGHGTTSTDANDRARIGVDIAGGGAGRLFFTTGAPASQTRAMFIDESQRVGIGTNNPTSRLEVNGAATNTVAFNAAAGTTIDFSKSNLAYTTANPGNTFTLSNIKDGGTYTLAVQGTTAGTAIFTASGFTFKTPNNGLTADGKETIYTFMVMGLKVYYYMTTGL